jgi:hypothetical protein
MPPKLLLPVIDNVVHLKIVPIAGNRLVEALRHQGQAVNDGADPGTFGLFFNSFRAVQSQPDWFWDNRPAPQHQAYS